MKWDLIIDLTSYILRRLTIFGIRGTFVGWVDNQSKQYSEFNWVSSHYSDSNGDWGISYTNQNSSYGGIIHTSGWKYITINIAGIRYICNVYTYDQNNRRTSSLSPTIGANAGGVYNKKIELPSSFTSGQYWIGYIQYYFQSAVNTKDYKSENWVRLSLT